MLNGFVGNRKNDAIGEPTKMFLTMAWEGTASPTRMKAIGKLAANPDP